MFNIKLLENLLLFCILSGLQASYEYEISFLNQSSPLYVAANPERTLSSQGDVEPEKKISNAHSTKMDKLCFLCIYSATSNEAE